MCTIVITGGTGGIGASLAKYFLEAGLCVVVNYCSQSKADALLSTLSQEAIQRALFVKADVSKPQEAADMFSLCQEKFGVADCLINCASINIDAYIKDMDFESWQRVIDVNLTGTFNCSKLFADLYTGNKGCIINISSGTAIHGRSRGANYCSSKAGVINLTKDFAIEYAPRIRVNCIGLGMIMTDEVSARYDLTNEKKLAEINSSIPMGYVGDVSDVVDIADFLMFRGRYITGQTIYVNGGMYMH